METSKHQPSCVLSVGNWFGEVLATLSEDFTRKGNLFQAGGIYKRGNDDRSWTTLIEEGGEAAI